MQLRNKVRVHSRAGVYVQYTDLASFSPSGCQVEEMERRCKCQQQQIFDLKQELVNSSAELKLRLAQAEGTRSQKHTGFCFLH